MLQIYVSSELFYPPFSYQVIIGLIWSDKKKTQAANYASIFA